MTYLTLFPHFHKWASKLIATAQTKIKSESYNKTLNCTLVINLPERRLFVCVLYATRSANISQAEKANDVARINKVFIYAISQSIQISCDLVPKQWAFTTTPNNNTHNWGRHQLKKKNWIVWEKING